MHTHIRMKEIWTKSKTVLSYLKILPSTSCASSCVQYTLRGYMGKGTCFFCGFWFCLPHPKELHQQLSQSWQKRILVSPSYLTSTLVPSTFYLSSPVSFCPFRHVTIFSSNYAFMAHLPSHRTKATCTTFAF